jgi:hypothetical protein
MSRTLAWYHADPVRAAFAVLRLCAGIAFALSSATDCTRPPDGPLAGASDAWAKPSESARPALRPTPTWDAYASVREWPAANAAPFISRGHEPGQAVDVKVNPEARVIYSALVAGSVLPEGSILAELSRSGDGRGYAMRKAGGSWSFFELDAAGGVISSGALALCSGCHLQAPADGVFGLPRAMTENR